MSAVTGRPSKRTAANQDKIIEALEKGHTKKSAAAAAGMTYQTFNEWVKDDSEFSDACEKAEGRAQGRIIDEIAKAKAWQAKAWIAERRWPGEFGARQHVEMTGKDGGPIEHANLTDGLDDHEKAALKSAILEELARRADARSTIPAVGAAGTEGTDTPSG